MKFLTWVSIQYVLSVIPNVTYFVLKLIIVMLCLNKNMVRFVQKCFTWLHSPISIEQNSHKAVSLIFAC